MYEILFLTENLLTSGQACSTRAQTGNGAGPYEGTVTLSAKATATIAAKRATYNNDEMK